MFTLHTLKNGMTQKLTMTLFADSTLSIFLPVVYTANFEMLGILIYMTVINKHAAKKTLCQAHKENCM